LAGVHDIFDVVSLNTKINRIKIIFGWILSIVKINLNLVDLTGKEFVEMSEKDIFLFYFKLRLFKKGKKETG